jgi:hypothetical protein
MATTSAPPTVAQVRAMPEDRALPRQRQAVEWWALLGVAWGVFWAYVLIRWVSGPYFHTVPTGPIEPPAWMRVLFTVWQAAAIPLVATGLFLMVVRPLRRHRTVPLDGLLFVAFIFMSLQDAGSDFLGFWYTTNSHLLNMGSFYNDIPGWLAFGRPGAQVPWVPLFHLIEYPFGMFVPVLGGGWVMRRLHARWNLHPLALVAIVFPLMMIWDLIIEGAFTNLGFYTMAGGRASFFPDSYSKFPLMEPFFIATLLTPVVALRYFRNDVGETLVERGVGKLRASAGRKVLLRALALIAFVQINYLVMYNIPVAIYMGAKPGVWPAQIQSHPYFTDDLCGPGTGRLCPGPGIPLTQQAWVNAKGRLRGPSYELGTQGAEADARALRQVGLGASPLSAFSGRILSDRSR